MEAAVKIAKSILLKKEKVEQGLLAYRTTLLETEYSRTDDETKVTLKHPVIGGETVTKMGVVEGPQKKLQEKRKKDKQVFDRRHQARKFNTLRPGQRVWIIDRKEYSKVVEQCSESKSYKIETTSGVICRNCVFLVAAQNTGGDIDYENFIRLQKV